MANVRFTRDEVILVLDVLYSARGESLSPRSKEIVSLSKLLNQLPIHPEDKRPENFRNCKGICNQINQFKRGYWENGTSRHLGSMFFLVTSEYEQRYEELHYIAQAIRRNLPYYTQIPFGSALEQDGFPEGALLGHLHRMVELRDGQKVPLEERCAVCQLEPAIMYRSCGPLLQNHLLVPPEELDGGKKYGTHEFMTVCRNCHAALHRFRPWLRRETCEELFR